MWSSTHLGSQASPARTGTVTFVVRCDDPAPASRTVLSIALLSGDHPEWDAQLVLLTHDERLVHPLVELVGGDVVVARAPLEAGWEAGTALAVSSRTALLHGGEEVDPAAVARLLEGAARCGPVGLGASVPAPRSSGATAGLGEDGVRREEPGAPSSVEVRRLTDAVMAMQVRLDSFAGALGDVQRVLQQVVGLVQEQGRDVVRSAEQLSVLEQRVDRSSAQELAGALARVSPSAVDEQSLAALAEAVGGLDAEYRRMRARTAFVSSFEARLRAVEER